ncbi:MAG: hypothetical protein AAF993_23235, partial [Pseudomonadota bacterium]
DNWGFRGLIWLGVLQRSLTGSGLAPAMRTSVAHFSVGDVSFATHPGETSPAYSLATRELLGSQHQFVLGLSQDAIGYILQPDYFANPDRYPHADYLTSVSVGATAGPQIMAALAALVEARREAEGTEPDSSVH